jgi:transcriptional regulator with XRE-family HTH domain
LTDSLRFAFCGCKRKTTTSHIIAQIVRNSTRSSEQDLTVPTPEAQDFHCLIPGAISGAMQMSTKAPNPVDKYVGSRVRMRRIMLGMSQEKLGEALGLTFQQVQKYEKGTNRVGASRLQQISEILQVPVSFLFDGGPSGSVNGTGFGEGASPAYVSDFLATSEGLALTRAFTRISDSKMRRSIVELVEQIASRDGPDQR